MNMPTQHEVLGRKPEFPVHDIFLSRHSPRAMSGEDISREELMSLFEAAKWAPSSYNNQPWRFLYAHRKNPLWQTFLGLLVEQNQTWCKHAAVLMVLVSKTTFDFNGKPARTHSFDAGAAWENLALQGTLTGLAVHAMQGFDYDRAKTELDIPDGYEVQAMIAVGKPGPKESLPPPLQQKESPSPRKKISEIAFQGKFPR